jgi:hypothetical protein
VTLDQITDTATFVPDESLELGLLYEATLTTGVEDLLGTALAAPYVWTFTIAEASEAPIALGSTSSFAVLGGSTVTSTGLTTVIGDLGVSPGTSVTGFGPGMLMGTQHLNDSIAVQAKVDLDAAYDEATARAHDPILVAAELGGQTLLPGLYRSAATIDITSGDVTLDADGDSAAVFVFQMTTTLTIVAGNEVILINGAKASNIYWQVGTSATLGANTVMAGTVMVDQSVTLNAAARVDGRVLARAGAVTMDTNPIVSPTP